MNEKISLRQFTLLLILFSIGTSVLISPSQLATTAMESGWIANLLSVILGLILLTFYMYIGRQQPNLNLFQHNEYAFGKWIGKILSLMVVTYSLIGACTVLWTVGNFIIVQIIPETPIAAIVIMFMGIVIYGTKLGLETIVKSVEIFFPWILMLLITIIMFSIPSMELKQLQPIFGAPLNKILGASLYESSISSLPLVLLLLLYPSFINTKSKGMKTILSGYLFAGMVVIGITVLSISVLGAQLVSHYNYPTYVMAERIEFIVLLDRLEAVIAISWILTIFFKLFLYFYVSLMGITETFKIRNYRSITIPLGIIVIGLSLIVYPDTSFAGKWNKETWVPLSIFVGFIYPLLLLVVSKIKTSLKSRS